jgi:hypothetical protein
MKHSQNKLYADDDNFNDNISGQQIFTFKNKRMYCNSRFPYMNIVLDSFHCLVSLKYPVFWEFPQLLPSGDWSVLYSENVLTYF